MYDLSKAYRSMQKSIANRRVEDWEASNGHTKDTTQLFHGPWHVSVDEHMAQSRLMGYQWCDISCEIQIIKIKIFYAS